MIRVSIPELLKQRESSVLCLQNPAQRIEAYGPMALSGTRKGTMFGAVCFEVAASEPLSAALFLYKNPPKILRPVT